jgi:hypothetical protein
MITAGTQQRVLSELVSLSTLTFRAQALNWSMQYYQIELIRWVQVE